MKSFLICIALVAFIFTTKAQSVKWVGMEEAIALNQSSPKKIMVDVYTDWCGWCKVMDKNTFMQPLVAEHLNNNFYPVKFNAEQKEDIVIQGSTLKFVSNGSRGSHQLAAALGATGYPYVVFLDEKLNIITSLPGYTKAQQFDKVIHFISGEHYKTQTFDQWSASYVSQIPAE